MGLSFYGVRDLLIEGLTVEETGGKSCAIITAVSTGLRERSVCGQATGCTCRICTM